MEGAIEEVLSGRMGYLKASKAFNVPQSTLEDRVKKARINQLTSSQAARKENTSIARAMGFNKQDIDEFFDLLEGLYEQHNFSPSDIYNVDETGITTVPNKPSKILASRGNKLVGALVSAERGVSVTAETCMNAAGNFMHNVCFSSKERKSPAA
ncbi:hypothetical protein JTB14_009540 [Gonioctena quinquepunctata]|nr:hypothetical protein JTB14_009540 [Gonioctena quinquepunctata]